MSVLLGCALNTSAPFTGSISVSRNSTPLTNNILTVCLKTSGGQPHTDCNAFINSNAGCGITEWSRASYGPFFDSQGGGVFAMKWDENGVSVCELIGTFFLLLSSLPDCQNLEGSFYRAAIPKDISSGAPNPSEWGTPSATLHASGCDIGKHFANHSIIFGTCFPCTRALPN